MGVVDVEPGAVGEDHVGQPEVLVGELARVGELPAQVEAARVAQRRLLLEVPPGPPRLDRGARVGVDHLRAGHHGVGMGLPLHRDAVLDLGAHHPSYGHGPSLRAAGRRARTDGRSPLSVADGGVVDRARRPRGHRRLPARARLGESRARACAGLSGEVLELGFGGGLNLCTSRPRSAVGAVEPSDVGWWLSERRRARVRCRSSGSGSTASRSTRPTRRTTRACARSPCARSPTRSPPWQRYDGSCGPAVRCHFLEHGLSDRPVGARWQHRLDPLAAASGRRLSPDP